MLVLLKKLNLKIICNIKNLKTLQPLQKTLQPLR